MEKYFDIMKRCPLFTGIEETDLSVMLNCLNARVVAAEKRQILFSEGDPAKSVGIVLSGAVEIAREDYYGRRSIVGVMEPSGMFGEVFACAGVPIMPVSVAAVEKSEILLLDCRRILTVCSGACAFHSRLIENLLRVVAEKNLLLNQKIEILSKRTTREKLMAYLLIQAKKNGSDEFTIPYGRQALADYLEVDRSAMSAEIGRLKREGVIDTSRKWFRLLRTGEKEDTV